MPAQPKNLHLVVALLALAAAGCDDVDTVASPLAIQADASADGSDAAEISAPRPEAPPDLSQLLPPGRVQAGIVVKDADLLTGPKVEGQLGDVKFHNSRVQFLIEGDRRGSGYRDQGAHVIDADIARPPGEAGADRFGELFLTWNLTRLEVEGIEVVDDGRDSGSAHVRFRCRTAPFAFLDSFLAALAPPATDVPVTYDYRLEADSDVLELTVSLTNDTDRRLDLDLIGLFSNHGDGVQPYADLVGFNDPGATFDLPYIGLVGLETSYGVYLDQGPLDGLLTVANLSVMTLPPTRLAVGETHTLKLSYTVGTRGSVSVEAPRRDDGDQEAVGRVVGEIVAPTIVRPQDCWVSIERGGLDVVGIVPVRPDGTWEAELPAGSYEVRGWSPQTGGSPVHSVTVLEAVDNVVDPFSLLDAGVVSVAALDQDGAPLPAQIMFIRGESTRSPHAPERLSFTEDWGRDISAVHFSAGARERIALPPGSYRVIASRGYSYELDEAQIELGAAETEELTFRLRRVVDTTGWMAADMHIHALWSSDSTVTYDMRARQAAAHEVTLPVLTEHAYVGDMMPAVLDAGLEGWLWPIIGQEVTTFQYGHFNVMPLEYDRRAPSFGGIFEHGHVGTGLFETVRQRGAEADSDLLLQINHPRGAGFGAYFEHVGLDPATSTPKRPERWTLDFDTVEVFNGRCRRSGNNGEAFADWVGLTNNGHRKTLSSGSDSHSVSKPLGHPRNWVKVDPADVEAHPDAIVAPLRARNTFVSCGPFVRFGAVDGTEIGGMTTVDGDGEALLSVTVEAPSWIAVDAVNLWQNGQVLETFELTHTALLDPERPALRFDQVIAVSPTIDSWYAVEVIGSGTLAPIKFSDSPYAFTNPIEVDADGDGVWTPPGP